ncbi:MAG TPA: hypothetical protein PK858_04495, partial [Saprospiraceae bacterium]|nr:hypothetical protein [Saprospiraceae bacterium]
FPVWCWPLLLLLAFCASKWGSLYHPYYWDEAWSYGHAIHRFAELPLGISPAALDPQLSRGHPLLFYVGAAGWLQVLGNHLFWAHAFALLLSVGTAWAVWRIGRQMSALAAGLAAMLLLLWTQMFWALAARLYPEMLVALCSLLALWAYHGRRLAAAVLWVALALFTKESAVAAVAALYAYALWRHRGLSRAFWADAAVLAVPVGLMVGWFAWQYALRGWWLFPEHTGMMVRDAGRVAQNFAHLLWTLLFYDGRVVLSLAVLVAAAWHRWRGLRPLRTDLKGWLLLSGLFVLAYLGFSALNFQTERYLVVPLVVAVLAGVLWVWEVFSPYPRLLAGLVLLYVGVQVYGLRHPARLNETSTGYLPMLESWQQSVRWCEQQRLQEGLYWTHFLMGYYMTDAHLGYLSGPGSFGFSPDTAAARYFLIDQVERDFTPSELPDLRGMRLLHRWGEGAYRVWLYERPEGAVRLEAAPSAKDRH